MEEISDANTAVPKAEEMFKTFTWSKVPCKRKNATEYEEKRYVSREALTLRQMLLSEFSLIVQQTHFELWLKKNNNKGMPPLNSPLNQEEKSFWRNILSLKKPSLPSYIQSAVPKAEKKVKTWLSHISRKKKDETEDAGSTGVASELWYGKCCKMFEHIVVDFI